MKNLLLALLSLGFAHAATITPEFLLQREIDRLLLAAEIQQNDPFAQALRKSTDWQRELLDSGPVENPSAIVATLHALWKHQPEIATHSIDRSMASACALESARGGMNPDQALLRFRFFQDRHRSGELNSIYDEIDTFNRRFLARGVQHTAFNLPESMEYLVSAISLPSHQYTSACWYAAYRAHNAFGDSIHGPHYYSPFRDSWGSHAERVREVGGVCGSLSNLGAAAAIANGIPAVTMGEPGHCAYAVMTSPGNWVPAYTLSWKRGMHTSFDGSTWGWHRLITEAMKSREKTSKSNDLRRLAMHQLESGKTANARQTIRLARTTNPIDWSNWVTSAKILNETMAGDEA
ncbi:MAG: hypothetical protein ACO3RV_09225, partial [Luteolibacter sp.]